MTNPVYGRRSLKSKVLPKDTERPYHFPESLKLEPSGHGVLEFDLPKGWTLRLTYYAMPRDFRKPGGVDAEFIPPRKGKVRSAPPARAGRPAEEAQP